SRCERSREQGPAVLGDENSREIGRRCDGRSGQEEDLRRDLGLDRVVGDDRDAEEIALGRLAGRGIDDVVQLAPVAAPAAAVAAGGGESAAAKLEGHGPGRRLAADRPCAAAGGDVAAGVREAGTRCSEQLGGTFGRIALADSAEIEAHTGAELDSISVDVDVPAAAGCARGPRRVAGDVLE